MWSKTRAVLVAISIPIFTSQLEKAREATDMANIRSAYAVVQAAALTEDTAEDITKNNVTNIVTFEKTTNGYKATITLKQQTADWQSTTHDLPGKVTGTPAAGGSCVVEYDKTKTSDPTTISF